MLTLLLVGCTDKGVYVGEKKDGKRHGQGTFTSPDGDKYVGGMEGWETRWSRNIHLF